MSEQPTVVRTADETQAAEILRRFSDGCSLDEVLSAGRGRYNLRRVLDVLAASGITLNDHGRQPRTAGYRPSHPYVGPMDTDHLLAEAARHADERIARLARHIRGDVATLRAVLTAERQQARADQRRLASVKEREQEFAAHAANHPQRRRRDQRTAES